MLCSLSAVLVNACACLRVCVRVSEWQKTTLDLLVARVSADISTTSGYPHTAVECTGKTNRVRAYTRSPPTSSLPPQSSPHYFRGHDSYHHPVHPQASWATLCGSGDSPGCSCSCLCYLAPRWSLWATCRATKGSRSPCRVRFFQSNNIMKCR